MEPKLIEMLGMGEAVPVPKIVASGRYQDRVGWSYLVLEYCPGLTIDAIRSKATRNELLGIAAQVGVAARLLHQTDVGLFDGVDAGESWDDLVDRRWREALTELVDRRVIGLGAVKALAEILEESVVESKGVPRVVVHGDLESDHILLDRTDGGWRVASVIDFGDATIGVRDYEWMPLWLNLFQRDAELMRTFIEAYDPGLLIDDKLSRRIMAWTLLHDFGTDAIADLLKKTGASTPVESLGKLQEVLWPGLANLSGR